MGSILMTHLFATFFLTGLCWFVQVIHYPLFKLIDQKDFSRYERANLRTLLLAGPVMVVELITGLLLLYYDLSSSAYWLNTGLILVIGLSTFIFQGPLHLMLSQEYSLKKINLLIRTNWIRTISWSLKSVLLIYLTL